MNALIKIIRLLNPLLWIEEKDAASWNKTCKINLALSYTDYLASEERLKKIKAKIQQVQN